MSRAQAALNFTGGTYSQDFDTLVTTGTIQPWSNDSTLPGWSLFQSAGEAITAYDAGDGGLNTGRFYSFGTGTATERALGGTASGGAYFGSPASGALAGYLTVAFENGTGSAITSFTLSFTGEQWRNGGNTTPQTMVLEYGFGPSFATVSTWTPGGSSFNFTSLQNTSTAAALNGNADANRSTGLGGTISSTWNSGDTLWIRWIENNDVGNDHGLAIDDFTLTVAAVPEPSTCVAGALLALPFGIHGVRYLRSRQKRA